MSLDSPDAWNARYAEGTTNWDLGVPAPVLERVWSELAAHETGGGTGRQRRVLVPGAGGGHDAVGWAQAGFEVVAVDFAPLAVASARAHADAAGVELEVVEADVRSLPDALYGSFDFVWEHTCLCALRPAMRSDYIDSMARALRPDGQLIACLWNNGREDGPPYDLPVAKAREIYQGRFREQDLWRSVASQRGGEEYVLWLHLSSP